MGARRTIGMRPKMTQDEFVIEEAGDKTILVRHLLAGVRFLFVMKDRKFAGVSRINWPRWSGLPIPLRQSNCTAARF